MSTFLWNIPRLALVSGYHLHMEAISQRVKPKAGFLLERRPRDAGVHPCKFHVEQNFASADNWAKGTAGKAGRPETGHQPTPSPN